MRWVIAVASLLWTCSYFKSVDNASFVFLKAKENGIYAVNSYTRGSKAWASRQAVLGGVGWRCQGPSVISWEQSFSCTAVLLCTDGQSWLLQNVVCVFCTISGYRCKFLVLNQVIKVPLASRISVWGTPRHRAASLSVGGVWFCICYVFRFPKEKLQ